MYNIDLQSRIPIYEQVYNAVKNMILDGEIKPNEKIISVRELAKALGVNPNTVTKAFNALERDNIIYTVPGKGSFAGKVDNEKLQNEALEEFDKAVKNALRLGVGKEILINRIGGQEDND